MMQFDYDEEKFILDDTAFQWYVQVMAKLPWNEALRKNTWGEKLSFRDDVFAYQCYDLFMSYFDLDERSMRSFFLLLCLGRYSKMARESCVKIADKFRKEAYSRCDTNRTGWVYDSKVCLLYTSPSPRDRQKSRMPSSA